MQPTHLLIDVLTVFPSIFHAAAQSKKSIQCSTGRSGPPIQPSDCHLAISLLPHDQPGDISYDNVTRKSTYPVFSPNAIDSRHRMPVYRSKGSCIVVAQMRDFAISDQSSWSIVSTMAQNVLLECIEDRLGVGGMGIVGEHGMIQVILCSTTCLEISKPLEIWKV